MKQADLSDTQQRVLALLAEACDEGLRQSEIREKLETRPKKIPSGTIASTLSRLESYGLVEKPEHFGREWLISVDGLKLIGSGPTPAPKPMPAAEPMPEPEPAPVADIADTAGEIDRALAALRARLDGQLPAEAIRVYQQVVEMLPAELVAALKPISDLVGAYPIN